MDWNFLAMEEGVEGDGNYYMQPHPSNTVSVMSSENLVDVIPLEQGSNVVFRTLEGISAGAGVEIIQFLEEGQQTMHLVEGINALPAGITEEEILAQLQAQQHSIPSANHTETSSSSRPADDQNMVNLSENNVVIMDNVQEGQMVTGGNVEGEALTVPVKASYEPQTVKDSFTKQESDVCPSDSIIPMEVQQSPAVVGELVRDEPVTVSNTNPSNQPFENLQESERQDMVKSDDGKTEQSQTSLLSESIESKNPSLCSPESKSGRQEKADISVKEPVSPTFKVPPSPQVTKVLSSQVSTAEPKSGTGTPHKATVTVFETVPECPKDVPMIIEILDDDDDDEGLLDDVPEEIDFNNYISSDEEDEAYKIQVENARALHRVKQAVDATAASYRPRFVSRVKLGKRHPRCKNLSFTEILKQTIIEDKILPDFNEQIIPRKIADKLRVTGHSLHKAADGGFMVSSKKRNVKCYHSSFSARFEPVLADPVLENYVQEYRKMLEFGMWRKSLRLGRKEVDPSSVIPASIGSTGSSSIGSETDPECLATDEEESESELMQGSVAAWIIPDAIESRTPSPEPDFDEPQFITTQVGSHTIVEGPPAKKRKQKHHEPKPHTDGKIYPKPAFSYSCLIAMALKNSKTGSLPVSEIYKFMCDHFPYFKSAPSGWKNSVRHNLSLNKCFEKIEKPGNNGARKGCLWALNPAKIHKMDEEVQKWSRKDPLAIRRAMSDPENLDLIEKGELKRDYSGAGASDDDEDEDFSEPATPLTPAQAQARRSRTNSSDSTIEATTAVVTPVVTTVSQVHAALQRSIEPKPQMQMKREDTVDLATITNIQGNYVCHTPNGNGTYTLSFANIGSSSPLTPIIIRRTPTVK